MSNRPATIKQADLTRLLNAMQKAGVAIGKVTHEPNGTLTIYPAGKPASSNSNPCDILLD
ncbi:hypothetical protein [Mameliella alba]|uniref:hypothetical protein n=1 Tax=Mameliella alba TaxID=561184 RepID=UPI000B5302A4|nr:hypothetical protein [Mameliella alba]OWV40779.1 hypothetical protein CDZ95_20480 [Mameliella alba]OWV52182.1 hypothetical protein CDZ97_26540 [Mameliella alba]BBU55278.1 hypothetical protein KU6B_15430 [Mameliella alba]